MKTVPLFVMLGLFSILFLTSCREIDDAAVPYSSRVNAEENASSSSANEPDPPKDPPKDEPKDLDNWKM